MIRREEVDEEESHTSQGFVIQHRGERQRQGFCVAAVRNWGKDKSSYVLL